MAKKAAGYRFNIVLYHDRKMVSYRIGAFPDDVYEKIQELIDVGQDHADKNNNEFNGSEPFKANEDEPRELAKDGPGAYANDDDDEDYRDYVYQGDQADDDVADATAQ